jgi:Subtilase family
MIKSSAGIVACAIAAFALTTTSAQAQPVDLVEQYVTSSSGPSPTNGPSGGSSASTRSGLDDVQADSPTPTALAEETATPVDTVQPPDATAPVSPVTATTTETTSAPATTDPPPTTDPTTITEPPPSTATIDSTTDRHDGTSSADQPQTDPLADEPPPAAPTAPSTAAGPRFLMRVRSAIANDVIARHRLTPIATVHETAPADLANSERLVLIAGPQDMSAAAIDEEMDADPDILGCEEDHSLALPELAGAATTPSVDAITQTLATQTVTSFYGADAPSTYVSQPASTLINLSAVRSTYTGAGIVAVIDTGVDATHPLLATSVMPGYDFLREQAGAATDLLDLEQSTAAILEQSTAAILEQKNVVVVNQSTAAILEQSTAAILEGLPPLPVAFGHGTMVAGLVHLTAPAATILPLKAFKADGTSTVANVVRAIYYAVDSGARVINMSFSVAESSPELMKAINYASSHRVTCVAASGNLGIETIVYPAAYRNVIAVASTGNTDVRSVFSNFGDADVTLAAPGESVTTTFPGGHYAAASGTSFSAAFVSGAVSLMLQETPSLSPRDALDNLTHGARTTPRLGYGRLDLQRALTKDHP